MLKKLRMSNVPPLDEAVGELYIPELSQAMALKLELIKSEWMPFIAEYEKEAEQFFSDLKKDISGGPLEKRSFYWFELLPDKYPEWCMRFRRGVWPPHFKQYFVDLPPEIKAGMRLRKLDKCMKAKWYGVYSSSCRKRLDLEFIKLYGDIIFGTVSESNEPVTVEEGRVLNDGGTYAEGEVPYDVFSNYVTFISKLHRYQVPSTGYIEEFLAGAYPMSRMLEVMEKVSHRVAESALKQDQSHFQAQMDAELFKLFSYYHQRARQEKEAEQDKEDKDKGGSVKRLGEFIFSFDL